MNKRYTLKQVMGQVHAAYDQYEEIAKQTLREEFGFGDKRLERFVERFSEVSARECEVIEARMRRRRR